MHLLDKQPGQTHLNSIKSHMLFNPKSRNIKSIILSILPNRQTGSKQEFFINTPEVSQFYLY